MLLIPVGISSMKLAYSKVCATEPHVSQCNWSQNADHLTQMLILPVGRISARKCNLKDAILLRELCNMYACM